jgi:hypothetical protein
LAQETLCIKDTATTSSVVGQREYAKPSTSIAIRRVTWNGRRLDPIDFMEDDSLTALNEDTTTTGTPLYFMEWEDSIFLRPVPATVQTIKMYFYKMPSEVTAVSTLDVPSNYQKYIVDFLLKHMFRKDQQDGAAQYHNNLWLQNVELVKGWERRKLRQAGPATVKDVDSLTETFGAF